METSQTKRDRGEVDRNRRFPIDLYDQVLDWVSNQIWITVTWDASLKKK